MAGQVTANILKLGDSPTPTQNFVLKTNIDGTATLARGNVGATTQDILTIDATGKVTLTNGEVITISKLQSGTVQNSTSGTSIDFTGIPSWVKRITVMFNGVSTSGTSRVQVQIGNSGVFESTGYLSVASGIGVSINTNASSGVITTGYVLDGYASASTYTRTGGASLVLIGNATWIASGVLADSTGGISCTDFSGSKTLSGALDRVRITTVNGTDTFDAGTINIMWE